MMRLLAAALIGLVALAGFTIGSFHARPAKATVGYYLSVNPGSSTNYMSCGWHSTCEDPWPWGNALDWGNQSGWSVYWRSWGVSDAGSGTMAYGFPRDATTSTCYGAAVDIYSLGWTFRGSAAYLHTDSTTTASFNIAGSWTGAFTSTGSLGTTVGSEKTDDCPWTDPHLHQYSTASGWYANTGIYVAAPDDGTGYPLSGQAYWQNQTSWAE